VQVLQSLCDRILDSRANAVFYISDADLVEYKAPAASYLLQIADFVGLPVIVWMADKSGLVPVGSLIARLYVLLQNFFYCRRLHNYIHGTQL
jgi:hypothetical protein